MFFVVHAVLKRHNNGLISLVTVLGCKLLCSETSFHRLHHLCFPAYHSTSTYTEQERQAAYKVKMWHVCVITVAVETQRRILCFPKLSH
jgi:hypothetical protein